MKTAEEKIAERPITICELSDIKMYHLKGESIGKLAMVFKRSQKLIAEIIDGKCDCEIIDNFGVEEKIDESKRS